MSLASTVAHNHQQQIERFPFPTPQGTGSSTFSLPPIFPPRLHVPTPPALQNPPLLANPLQPRNAGLLVQTLPDVLAYHATHSVHHPLFRVHLPGASAKQSDSRTVRWGEAARAVRRAARAISTAVGGNDRERRVVAVLTEDESGEELSFLPEIQEVLTSHL
jgi:hypothetical protein